MKKIVELLIILLVSTFWSCDNEVKINAEFEEVTVIYGLLNQNADTQFVKINKTFLDDEKSAIDLANDPNQLFYDSLTVSLIEETSGSEIFLSPLELPKKPGAFTNERNTIYFTEQNIESNKSYRLQVVKPDGSISTGKTAIIDTVYVKKPFFGLAVPFVDRNGSIDRYRFDFETGKNVAEFEVVMNFKFTEIIGPDSIQRTVRIPLSKFTNSTLEPFTVFPFNFDGLQFFKAIEAQVPASVNPTKKVIFPRDNLDIEIFAADEDYSFYRELNGPIDGLAQTRPEFTNITDGYGLFASRLSMIYPSRINDDTRIYIVNEYKDTRNFSFP